MTRQDRQLRLLLTGNEATPGQVLLVGTFALVPLHVRDYRFARQSQGVLHDTSRRQPAEPVGPVIATVPQADCSILARACEYRAVLPLDLEPTVRCGDPSDIHFLEAGPGGVVERRIRTVVDDLVTVSSYAYRSASGTTISLVDANVIILRHTVPLGASGAPVRAAKSRRIIGLVHGVAPEFGNATICLSPLPIVAELDRQAAAVPRPATFANGLTLSEALRS